MEGHRRASIQVDQRVLTRSMVTQQRHVKSSQTQMANWLEGDLNSSRDSMAHEETRKPKQLVLQMATYEKSNLEFRKEYLRVFTLCNHHMFYEC